MCWLVETDIKLLHLRFSPFSYVTYRTMYEDMFVHETGRKATKVGG